MNIDYIDLVDIIPYIPLQIALDRSMGRLQASASRAAESAGWSVPGDFNVCTSCDALCIADPCSCPLIIMSVQLLKTRQKSRPMLGNIYVCVQ